MIATLLVQMLLKLMKSERVVLAVTVCLYGTGLMLGTYSVVFGDFKAVEAISEMGFIRFIGTRNGLFYAPVYVASGMFLRRHYQRIQMKSALALLVASVILFGLETVVATLVLRVETTVMWIFMLPATFFLCAVIGRIRLNDCRVYPFMRRMSTAIYLLHMPVYWLLKEQMSGVLLYVVVLAISTACAVLVSKLPREKIKWIGYIC